MRSLNHPHPLADVVRVFGHIQLEDLEHVYLGRTACKAAVAEHRPERLAPCYLLDNAFGDIFVKAGDEIAVVICMHGAARYLFRRVRHGERQAPIKQSAEQEVEVGAVVLDVGDHIEQVALLIFVRGIIDVFHIAAIEFEHAEADVDTISQTSNF